MAESGADASAKAGQKKTGQLKAGAPNIFGVSSLETFADVSGLSQTHEDADGFAAYFAKFYAPNFRFRDEAVQYWEYTEPYDDWQDQYGTDAVRVFYHSGHGTMDANGVFMAPLGKDWGGHTRVFSNQVLQGNERLRYIFWSTCLSLRVLEGHSPIRTWNEFNRGVRMFFGWETVSWDLPGYGAWFWNHWNSGQSLGTAWLNSGWDGGHDQAPSVAACGATQAEAQNRVFNERLFSPDAASSAWWWWRWYGAVRSVAGAALSATVPQSAFHAQFGAGNFGRQLEAMGETTTIGNGRHLVRLGGDTGELAEHDLFDAAVVSTADGVIGALGLDGVDLKAHHVRAEHSAGGTDAGDGTRSAELVSGHVVEYRQTIGGLPILNTDRGFVRVHLNSSGMVTSAEVAVRPVEDLVEVPAMAEPRSAAGSGQASAGEPNLDELFARAAHRAVTRSTHAPLEAARVPVSAAVVPDSRQVGYLMSGSRAVLGATEGIEVDCGDGFRKKLPITVRLNG
jgi:hypothetical protein